MYLHRRQLLAAGIAGGGLLSLPSWARAPIAGFTHAVASGEPGPTSVLLWTRYVSSSPVRLTAEVSTTPDFARVVAGGSVEASPARDHTAKLVVTGLAPDRWYHYRFVAPDGTRSPVGRTRTLPGSGTRGFNLGVFSCANLPFGLFNAYGHAAGRRDIDLMVHLGDYLYEYRAGEYPDAAEALSGRVLEPLGEITHLADYRARYAGYRRDADLQALHQRFPMVVMYDDHESANDSWRDGAENHDPATEGDWSARKAAALQAWHEWMPVSDAPWASYRIGDLATLFRPEERLLARTKEVSLADALAGRTDVAAALGAFRDGTWSDPAHTLFGPEQEQWFAATMKSAARATRWQVLAQQVNMGFTYTPAETTAWVSPDAPAYVKQRVAVGTMAAKLGIPANMDSWNGYPAARSRLLASGLEADANLIVLSGDSHNAWAFDLAQGKAPAGVEFGGHSVTSPGYEAYFPRTDPQVVARAIMGSSPELKWADTARRGYMTVALSAEAATAEWLFVDTIRAPSRTIADRHRATVRRGARRMTA
jgi:alkaline phosphatase D